MHPLPLNAPARRAAAKNPSKSLGSLPEWNLADLYPAMDDPAIKRDLDRGETECIEFEKAYKGRLADIAASADAGRALAEAVRRFEGIEDVLVPYLNDPDWATRAAALEVLCGRPSEGVKKEIERLYDREEDDTVRKTIEDCLHGW